MTDRIDHEARALESDKLTKDQWATFAFETSDASNIYMAIDELKHAALALVEQQRIANRLKLASQGWDVPGGGLVRYYIMGTTLNGDGEVWGARFDPEIVAALRLTKEEA